jgi:hypothetical protein
MTPATVGDSEEPGMSEVGEPVVIGAELAQVERQMPLLRAHRRLALEREIGAVALESAHDVPISSVRSQI